jgi:hypothetical protein
LVECLVGRSYEGLDCTVLTVRDSGTGKTDFWLEESAQALGGRNLFKGVTELSISNRRFHFADGNYTFAGIERRLWRLID